MKRKDYMLLITKSEAFGLREQGWQDYIKKSASRHPKYYLVEDYKALNALERYRKNKLIKEYK